MIRVCVYPAQNESAVEINNALSNCEGVEVFGIAPTRGHNEFNFKNYTFGFPQISDPSFDEKFQNFIEEHQIDVVFPTNDACVVYFSKNKDKFSAKIVNSDLESAIICNDKRRTYNTFMDCDFCPIVFTTNNIEYPCFVKPADGEGAIGARIVKSPEELPHEQLNDLVVLEYLPGEEMTVDCISDRHHNLIKVLPRKREKVFSGMSVYGSTVLPDKEVLLIANTINARLKLSGLWYFQIKKSDSGVYKLLEISMRCAGTMCQTRARGYNLPLLSVYTALGKDIEALDNTYAVTIDRTLFARYKTDLFYNTVYIDYDGTIVVKGEICLAVIRFLYQCKNNGKRIVMISRHNEDHENTLEEDMINNCISKELFDDIICLSFTDEKSSVIKDKESIFIDNSFFERKKVAEQIRIPVFGVENLDVLQDWRL